MAGAHVLDSDLYYNVVSIDLRIHIQLTQYHEPSTYCQCERLSALKGLLVRMQWLTINTVSLKYLTSILSIALRRNGVMLIDRKTTSNFTTK